MVRLRPECKCLKRQFLAGKWLASDSGCVKVSTLPNSRTHSPLAAFGFVFSLFFGHFSCQDISSPAREGSWDPGSGNSVFEPPDCQGSHSSSEFWLKKVSKTTVWKAFVAFLFSFAENLKEELHFPQGENWVISRTTHVIWRLEVKLWSLEYDNDLGESWTCELSEAVIRTDPRY